MLNKAILMGRLTRDPELRHTQTKKAREANQRAGGQDFTPPPPGDGDWSELPDDEGDVPWMT